MNELKPWNREIEVALRSAFPTPKLLEMMCRRQLNHELMWVGEGNLVQLVFDLIRWAESHGKEAELLAGARRENPDNPMLQELAEVAASPLSVAPLLGRALGVAGRHRSAASAETFMRGNLEGNPEVAKYVIRHALRLLDERKPHHIVVSVLGTVGGQVQRIVRDVKGTFAGDPTGTLGAESFRHMLSVFGEARAVYVRVMMERLVPTEKEVLEQLCSDIRARLRDGGMPLQFHLSIRGYSVGAFTALRGVTIASTDDPLQPRAGSHPGHYEMETPTIVAATMGPRELREHTTSRDYCYEVLAPGESERSDVWSGYMHRLFEHFWGGSETCLLHRVERGE